MLVTFGVNPDSKLYDGKTKLVPPLHEDYKSCMVLTTWPWPSCCLLNQRFSLFLNPHESGYTMHKHKPYTQNANLLQLTANLAL